MLSLPDELLYYIGCKLNKTDTTNFAYTCKRVYSLVMQNIVYGESIT